MEDEEKKKKSAFSFLRAIGLDSNKKEVPDKNKFYAGNVVTAAKNKKKKLDEITD